jgi:hypothetical protein
MIAGFAAAYFCIKAFSETDQTEDLKKFDVPTLITQGDDDQIVSFVDAGLLQSKAHKARRPSGITRRSNVRIMLCRSRLRRPEKPNGEQVAGHVMEPGANQSPEFRAISAMTIAFARRS